MEYGGAFGRKRRTRTWTLHVPTRTLLPGAATNKKNDRQVSIKFVTPVVPVRWFPSRILKKSLVVGSGSSLMSQVGVLDEKERYPHGN